MNARLYSNVCFFISFSLLSRAPLADLHSRNMRLLSTHEMRLCHISFITIDGKNFLVKQKKKSTIRKRLGIVREAVASHIAESLGLAHKVDIIGGDVLVPGKVCQDCPATLHTIAPGKMVRDQPSIPYAKMDLKQGDAGFTFDMLKWMAKHTALAKVVAFDTFVCNHDRHQGNIFYDEADDSFCAIDMEASLKFNLSALACQTFTRLINSASFSLNKKELKALMVYKNTLEFLVKTYNPTEIIQKYNVFAELVGIGQNSPLYKKALVKLEQDKNMIKRNYQYAQRLIKIIDSVIAQAIKNRKKSLVRKHKK